MNLSFGYTSEIYGDSTQLTYLRSRFYASGAGRFLTRDTWRGDVNNPQSLNRFAYVENSPINFSDPTGNYGPAAHYRLIKDLVASSPYIPVIDAGINFVGGIAEFIALNDLCVDFCNTYNALPIIGDPVENTKYHFQDLQTARGLIENALMTRKVYIFGRYLHTLQDAYAHDREGYTSTHEDDSKLAKNRNKNLIEDFYNGYHWAGTGINKTRVLSPYPAHPHDEVLLDVLVRNPWFNTRTFSDDDLIDLYLRYDKADPNKDTRRQERSYFGFETDKYIPFSTRDTLMRVETKMWIDRLLFDYMMNPCAYTTQEK